jgi:hypothetical protein
MDLIDDASFREGLYREIHQRPSQAHRPLLRELLIKEMKYREEDPDSDFFENLYWCGFLLYRIGDVSDVALLWQAKNVNFDTASGFDVQFLVGAGVEETIRYLQMKSDKDSRAALEYLVKSKEAGDFDDLATWFRWRDQYFTATNA